MILILIVVVYFILLFPGKKRTSDILNVRYFAHRGFHHVDGIPENSMAAFKKAKEIGYGIELDVQLTKDGVMVVHHDYNLSRMCGKDILIADLTYEELKKYRLNGTKEGIPKFHDVLKEIKGEVPLLIELKMEHCNRKLCEKVAKELDHYEGLYCMESFHPYALYWFKKHRPDVIRGTLSCDYRRDHEPGNQVAYWISTRLLTNVLVKPDFIAYKYQHKKGSLSLFLCEKLYRMPIYGWTFRKRSEYKVQKDNFYGFIFERFMI